MYRGFCANWSFCECLSQPITGNLTDCMTTFFFQQLAWPHIWTSRGSCKKKGSETHRGAEGFEEGSEERCCQRKACEGSIMWFTKKTKGGELADNWAWSQTGKLCWWVFKYVDKIFINERCISEIPTELFTRPTAGYSEQQKEFSVLLHLYSPKAYEFLRGHLCLPSPRTIRR